MPTYDTLMIIQSWFTLMHCCYVPLKCHMGYRAHLWWWTNDNPVLQYYPAVLRCNVIRDIVPTYGGELMIIQSCIIIMHCCNVSMYKNDIRNIMPTYDEQMIIQSWITLMHCCYVLLKCHIGYRAHLWWNILMIIQSCILIMHCCNVSL